MHCKDRSIGAYYLILVQVFVLRNRQSGLNKIIQNIGLVLVFCVASTDFLFTRKVNKYLLRSKYLGCNPD